MANPELVTSSIRFASPLPGRRLRAGRRTFHPSQSTVTSVTEDDRPGYLLSHTFDSYGTRWFSCPPREQVTLLIPPFACTLRTTERCPKKSGWWTHQRTFRPWTMSSLEDIDSRFRSECCIVAGMDEASAGQSARFVIEDELGEGALGRVFRARDSASEMRVAVKRLRRKSADDAVWLKREFRFVAELAHPNLVELYDLVVEEDDVLVSMELVDGVPFPEHVRKGGSTADDGLVARLLGAAAQLAAGLNALHVERRLHRDIKPGNVLVDDSGRVVLLDFDMGLWDLRNEGEWSHGTSGGTPAYMAPEALFGKATPASDWYGVGVLLFETLTGRLPLPSAPAVRRRPTNVSPDLVIPAELDQLVVDLLDPDPARRAGFERTASTMRRLAGGGMPAWSPPAGAGWQPPFVGRHQELQLLDEEWRRARSDRALPVTVTGPSGIGKSALVRTWLARAAPPPTAVLYGRCNPHESVPYRGVDGVVDALKGLLERLPVAALPEHLEELAVMFPALGGIAGSRGPGGSATYVRAHAVDSLRRAIRAVSGEGIVIWIDDLQWSGRDTVELLEELLRDDSLGRVLWLFTSRSTEPFPASIERTELQLGPLDRTETAALLDTVQAAAELPLARRRQLLEESAGSPFVASELARWLASSPGASADVDGAQVIGQRVAALPRAAREVLELVSVGALPLPRRIVLEVTGVSPSEPWLAHLRAERLLRRSADSTQLAFEAIHDRIREAVVSQLPAERRRSLHRRLAEASEAQPRHEPDFMLYHWCEAGERDRAIPYAVAAARRAEAALAFNRAAELYGRALELGAAEPNEMRTHMARALARAGRTNEAAAVYEETLAALPRSSPQRHELLRERAEQYLRGGDRAKGLAALKESLAHQGLGYPATASSALFTVLKNRARIWWLGGGLKERLRRPDADELCQRSDASWSAGLGLNMFDMMRSFAFQTDHVRLALESGDDLRLLYALSSEVVYRACEGGPKNRAYRERLTHRALDLSRRVGSADATAMMELSFGVGEYFSAAFDESIVLLDRAHRAFAARQEGITWEVLNCLMYRAWSLRWRGDLAQMRAESEEAVRSARHQGNKLAEMALSNAHGNLAVLAYEGSERAAQIADESVRPFEGGDFQSPQYMHLLARAHCDLAAGNGEAAWRRAAAAWPHLRSLGFFRMQLFRTELSYLRACAAIAAARAMHAERRKLLREAEATARALSADDSPVAQALGCILAAGLGGGPIAGSRVTAAADAAARAGLRMHEGLLRWRQGRDSSWLEAQRVPDPARLARALLPAALLSE